jgi:hypothetical protein
MSSFISVTMTPGQFVPLGTYNKVASVFAPVHAYTVQPTVLDVDPTTSLWFPSYVLHGVNVGFVYYSLMQCTPTGLSDNSCFIFSILLSKSNGELFTSHMQNKNRNIPGFSTLSPQDLSPHLTGTGLRWSLMLPVSMLGFSQDPLMPVLTIPEVT